MTDLARPGFIPAPRGMVDGSRFQAPLEQPLMADIVWESAGRPELPPGPKLLRMGSGDYLNRIQFADQIQKVQPGSIPAVHGPDKTTWFGEGDIDAEARNG